MIATMFGYRTVRRISDMALTFLTLANIKSLHKTNIRKLKKEIRFKNSREKLEVRYPPSREEKIRDHVEAREVAIGLACWRAPGKITLCLTTGKC